MSAGAEGVRVAKGMSSLIFWTWLLLMGVGAILTAEIDDRRPLEPKVQFGIGAAVTLENVAQLNEAEEKELLVRTQAIIAAREANPTLDASDLKRFGDVYVQAYRKRNQGTWTGAKEDLKAVYDFLAEQAKASGFEVKLEDKTGPIRVTPKLPVIPASALIKLSQWNASHSTLVDPDIVNGTGPSLIKKPSRQWANDQDRANLGRNVFRIWLDPVMRNALSEQLRKLNGLNPDVDTELLLSKNSDARKSIFLKQIFENTESFKKTLDTFSQTFDAWNSSLRAIGTANRKASSNAEMLTRNLSQELNSVLEYVNAERARKEKEENARRRLAPGRAAVMTAQALFPQDPVVQASALVTDAALDIAHLVLTDSLNELSLSSFVNVYAIVFNLGNQLFSIFGGSKSPHQLLLEEVHALREQVHRLHLAMLDRFGQMRSQIEALRDEMDYRFEAMEHLVRYQFNDLRDRQRHSQILDRRILDSATLLSREIQTWQETKENRETEIACLSLDCQRWKDELMEAKMNGRLPDLAQIREYLSVKDLEAAMNLLLLNTTHFQRDPIATGVGLPLKMDAKAIAQDPSLAQKLNRTLADRLSLKATEQELRTVIEAMNALGIPISAESDLTPNSPLNLTELANVPKWIQYAQLFRKYATQWDAADHGRLYVDYDRHLVNLGKIIDEGRRLESTLTRIAPTDSKGQPNALPVLKLVENYLSEIDRLGEVLAAKQQVFVNTDGKLKRYDPFTQLREQRPGPTSLTARGLFAEGAISPCPEVTVPEGQTKVTLPVDPNGPAAAKMLELIPSNARIAHDLLGGKIRLCYEAVEPANRTQTVARNFTMGGWNLDVYHEAQLSFVIRAEYIHPEKGTVPLFRKQLLDPERVDWSYDDYDAMWEKQDPNPRQTEIRFLGEIYDAKTNALIRQTNEDNQRLKDWIKGDYRGLKYLFSNERDAAKKRYQTAAQKWPALQSGLWDEKQHEILSAADREASLGTLEAWAGAILRTQVLDFYQEAISKDAESKVGTLGDVLREIEGARLLLSSGLGLIYGDAIETDTRILRKIDQLPGENSLSFLIWRNPEHFGEPAKLQSTLGNLRERAFELVHLLWEENEDGRPLPSVHSKLAIELRSLETTYAELAKHRSHVTLPTSLAPSRAAEGPRVPPRQTSERVNTLASWLADRAPGPRPKLRDVIERIQLSSQADIPKEDQQKMALSQFVAVLSEQLPQLVKEEAYRNASEEFIRLDTEQLRSYPRTQTPIEVRSFVEQSPKDVLRDGKGDLVLNWPLPRIFTDPSHWTESDSALATNPGYRYVSIALTATPEKSVASQIRPSASLPARDAVERAWEKVAQAYSRSVELRIRLPYFGSLDDQGPVVNLREEKTQAWLEKIHADLTAVTGRATIHLFQSQPYDAFFTTAILESWGKLAPEINAVARVETQNPKEISRLVHREYRIADGHLESKETPLTADEIPTTTLWITSSSLSSVKPTFLDQKYRHLFSFRQNIARLLDAQSAVYPIKVSITPQPTPASEQPIYPFYGPIEQHANNPRWLQPDGTFEKVREHLGRLRNETSRDAKLKELSFLGPIFLAPLLGNDLRKAKSPSIEFAMTPIPARLGMKLDYQVANFVRVVDRDNDSAWIHITPGRIDAGAYGHELMRNKK